jgi:hypothetical protein
MSLGIFLFFADFQKYRKHIPDSWTILIEYTMPRYVQKAHRGVLIRTGLKTGAPFPLALSLVHRPKRRR